MHRSSCGAAADAEASFDREFMPMARAWANPTDEGLPARISSEAPSLLRRYPSFRRMIEQRRLSSLAHWHELRGQLPEAVVLYRALLRRRLLDRAQSRIILHGHISLLLVRMGKLDEARRASGRGLALAVKQRQSLMCITRLSDFAEMGPVRPTRLRLRAFEIAQGRPPRRSAARRDPVRFAEAVLEAWLKRNGRRPRS